MKSLRNQQRGYSLIELSIALAIVGIVIAGAITGVQSILRSNNVNATVTETNEATGKIVAKLVRDPDYSGATTANLAGANMGIWRPTRISTSAGVSTVSHAFGGQVFVAPLASSAHGVAANQGYIYTLAGIPGAACTDLVLGLEGLATAIGVSMAAAPVATAQTAMPATVIKGPGVATLTASTVNTACNVTSTNPFANITLLIARS